MISKLVAKFSTILSAGITTSSPTMSLASVTTRKGETLPSGQYGLTIGKGEANEETVEGNLVGSTFTFTKRGISDLDGFTEVLANKYSHRKGESITLTGHNAMTDMSRLFEGYLGHWEGAVANFAALPVGLNDGEARVTLDDGKIYTWDSTSSTWIIAGAGGSAGTVYITTKMGNESTMGDNLEYALNSGSYSSKKYIQVYKNGVLMTEGASNDYIAVDEPNNYITFNEATKDDDIITLLVVSVDIYNPAWNNVTADVLPDLTESWSIGSALKKFKDIFLSGAASIAGSVTAASFIGDGSGITNIKPEYFGYGGDGDVTISADTTLTKDMYYNNLTINSTKVLNPNGYRIFVKETLTNNGIIRSNGGNGGNGNGGGNAYDQYSVQQYSIGGTGGSAGSAANTQGSMKASKAGVGGGTGGNGSVNASQVASAPSAGTNGLQETASASSVTPGAGGTGGNGGAGVSSGNTPSNGAGGGSVTAATAVVYGLKNIFDSILFLEPSDYVRSSMSRIGGSSSGSAGGGGGGGGAYYNYSNSNGSAGGGGGGSAGAGGNMYICAKIFINNGTIEANGGTGGNGGASGSAAGNNGYTGGTGGGGGGGAGGTGGMIYLISSKYTTLGTVTVTGGTGGTGGIANTNKPAACGQGTNGANGATGTTGTIIQVII